MNEQQISHLTEHYSAMSDEELADLLITRQHSLTEEANFALKIVLKKRNMKGIEEEISEKKQFYATEQAHVLEQVKKSKKQRKDTRKLARNISLIGVLVGVLIMIFDNFDAGLKFGGVMIVPYIYVEWKLFIWSAISRLFHKK